MADLIDLLTDVATTHVIGPLDRPVREVVYDSRRVRPGDVFVAVPGFRDDGTRYVGQALAAGAAAIVAERPDLDLPDHATFVVVPNARRALGLLAAANWDHPSRRLGLVGVTGTDGKTTTSILTAEILQAAGFRSGLVSTVELRLGGRRVPNRFNCTTPEAPEMQKCLAQVVTHGGTWAVLELSSHGLALERAAGCEIDVAVMTNISPEHLDFHGTLEAYRAAKASLFSALGQPSGKRFPRFGVVNADDPHADYFRSACPVDVISYGIKERADVRAHRLELGMRGTSFVVDTPIGSRRLETRLVGRFNVYNWLAAIAVAVGQGIGWEAITRAATEVEPILGRVERVETGRGFTVLVDFAHTPQALSTVLADCRWLVDGKVIVVFGHPGERYAENRPRLGSVAVRGADLAIITSDDAYGEEPGQIIDGILEGAVAAGGVLGDNLLVIPDRRSAIRRAVELAGPGDLVLIAGRGHLQDYVVGQRHTPFADARVAREALQTLPPLRERPQRVRRSRATEVA